MTGDEDDKQIQSPLADFRADPAEHDRDAGSAPAMLRIKLLAAGGKPKPRERWAFPYTTLRRVELESGSELLLYFMEATVTVKGPKMGELFDLVAQHKIALIEVVNQGMQKAAGRPLTAVDSVDITIAEPRH